MEATRRSTLSGDLIAGSIVAVLLVPQSMAYAMLAGVPPVYGLYAAALPLLAYSLFGSSKHLSVGPVSIVALLTFSGVGVLAEPYGASYVGLTAMLSLIVGMLLLLFGFLRIGRYLDRISPFVIHGFTSAAAIIICMQQLGALIGVPLPREEHVAVLLPVFLRQLSELHPATAAVGLSCFAILYALHKLLPVALGPLVIVAVSAAAVKRFSLHRAGVDIVGSIPGGLPAFHFGMPTFDAMYSLLPTALAIALITFFESYAVASSIAQKASYPLQANRELLGLGAANVASSLVGSFPVAGAFSRTAVSYASGGRTKASSLFTAGLLFVTVMYFTKMLYFMPKAALAAIIVFSVARLIDLHRLLSPGQANRSDYATLVVTFCSTLFIGVAQGLLLGIGLSWLLCRIRRDRNNPY